MTVVRIILCLITLASVPAWGQEIAAEEPASQTEKPVSIPLEELQLFADTFDAIRKGYVEEVSDAELFEMAVRGMLTSLDRIQPI